MRVLYVNPFSQEVSGPDQSLLVLLQHLIPLGIEAHLILPAAGPFVPRYRQLGVTVHFAPVSILRRRVRPADVVLLGARLARGAAAVGRIARAIRADLIHTNMEVVLDGALAARLLRIPHVMHYRGNSLDEPRLVFDALTAVWSGLSARVFCISSATAAVFQRRGRGSKVEVLYNPVDLGAFAAASVSGTVRRELGAEDGDLLVGTVARIHPRKDLETFVRAAAAVSQRVPRARFVVVGAAEGPAEERYQRSLEALAGALGLGLRFTGARRDIPAVMKALDLLVLTSRHEGFGRVVAEAMAAGRPVVVTREGALPELVEEGRQGFCAAPGDAAQFAERIGTLLQDADLRRRMGESGAARAKAFDAAAIARRVAACYRAVVA